MKKRVNRVMFWLPRVLGVLFALFISLFALDVFGQGYGFWGTLLALLIHLLPTYLVLLALALAWRWEGVGALLFMALGLWYVVMTWGEMRWSAYLLIAGPPFLIGALFLLQWLNRDRIRSRASGNGAREHPADRL
jgi:hypothetical protein